MVLRRAEIPRLNLSVTRTIRYSSGEAVYGTIYSTLERTVRARRLVIAVRDQISIQGPRLFDVELRRYLVRPSREVLTFMYDNDGNDEERTITLSWSVGDLLQDGSDIYTVSGVEPYDQSGAWCH